MYPLVLNLDKYFSANRCGISYHTLKSQSHIFGMRTLLDRSILQQIFLRVILAD